MNSSPKTSVSPRHFVCLLIGHHFKITLKITNHINEYKCKNCGKEMTDSMSGSLEDLNYKKKKVNKTLSTFFKKKQRIYST